MVYMISAFRQFVRTTDFLGQLATFVICRMDGAVVARLDRASRLLNTAYLPPRSRDLSHATNRVAEARLLSARRMVSSGGGLSRWYSVDRRLGHRHWLISAGVPRADRDQTDRRANALRRALPYQQISTSSDGVGSAGQITRGGSGAGANNAHPSRLGSALKAIAPVSAFGLHLSRILRLDFAHSVGHKVMTDNTHRADRLVASTECSAKGVGSSEIPRLCKPLAHRVMKLAPSLTSAGLNLGGNPATGVPLTMARVAAKRGLIGAYSAAHSRSPTRRLVVANRAPWLADEYAEFAPEPPRHSGQIGEADHLHRNRERVHDRKVTHAFSATDTGGVGVSSMRRESTQSAVASANGPSGGGRFGARIIAEPLLRPAPEAANFRLINAHSTGPMTPTVREARDTEQHILSTIGRHGDELLRIIERETQRRRRTEF